jgi:hypothetical protein
LFHHELFVAFLWIVSGPKYGKGGQRLVFGKWYVFDSIIAREGLIELFRTESPQQIPFGNNNQRGRSNRRSPPGMTTRKAKAEADSLRE